MTLRACSRRALRPQSRLSSRDEGTRTQACSSSTQMAQSAKRCARFSLYKKNHNVSYGYTFFLIADGHSSSAVYCTYLRNIAHPRPLLPPTRMARTRNCLYRRKTRISSRKVWIAGQSTRMARPSLMRRRKSLRCSMALRRGI